MSVNEEDLDEESLVQMLNDTTEDCIEFRHTIHDDRCDIEMILYPKGVYSVILDHPFEVLRDAGYEAETGLMMDETELYVTIDFVKTDEE